MNMSDSREILYPINRTLDVGYVISSCVVPSASTQFSATLEAVQYPIIVALLLQPLKQVSVSLILAPEQCEYT